MHRRDVDKAADHDATQDCNGDGPGVAKGRRLRLRGRGRFSSRQMTAVIIALIAAMALPSTAFAVDAFTNVAIEDPVSGNKARVSGDGRLLVSSETPGTPYFLSSTATHVGCAQPLGGTGGCFGSTPICAASWTLTSITLANGGLARAVVKIVWWNVFNHSGTVYIGTYVVAANTTVTIPFPTPISIPNFQFVPFYFLLTEPLGNVDIQATGTYRNC